MTEDIAQSLDAWRATGRALRYRGHRVFYQTAGAGEVLLCIHGFPTASWDWHRLWPRLSAYFHVIAADMLGFGFSDKPVHMVYDIAAQADLLESLLLRLGVERVHLLAHDYGDTVAQEMLARQGESAGERPTIASAVFLNGGLFPETHRPLLTQRLLATPLGGILARRMNRQRFAKSLRRVFADPQKLDDAEVDRLWQLVTFNDGLRLAPRLIRYMSERRRHRDRWVRALSETAVPLRVIDGAEDPVSGRHMTERYRELVPEPDVVVLPGVGHWPQLEAPDEVWSHFVAFHAERVGTPMDGLASNEKQDEEPQWLS